MKKRQFTVQKNCNIYDKNNSAQFFYKYIQVKGAYSSRWCMTTSRALLLLQLLLVLLTARDPAKYPQPSYDARRRSLIQ